MAMTDWGAITNAQKKVWQARTWKQARDQSFWFQTGFMSSGSDDHSKPVDYVKDLTQTDRGATCVMHLIPDLAGDGVAGDNLLKGKEEALSWDDVNIQIDQLRNAVRSRGAMSEQKTVVRFRVEAKDTLGNWAAQKLDEMAFLVASGVAFTANLDGSTRAVDSDLPNLSFAADVTSPTTNRIKYAGTATATNNLQTTDKMTWNTIVTATAFAKRQRIKPMRYSGREGWCVVLSTEQARDLKQDPNYQTNVGRAAQQSAKNPLFSGYFADIDGICLFEHPKVKTTLGATSGSKYGAAGTVDGAQALLLGAQALGFARIHDVQWVEDKDDDFGNRQNVGVSLMMGFRKPKFTSIYTGASEDFSVVSLYSAAAA